MPPFNTSLVVMAAGNWWDNLHTVWKLLTGFLGALVVAGSIGWTANDIWSEKTYFGRLEPRVLAVKDSVSVLRVHMEQSENDLSERVLENREAIEDVRRILVWQICTRDPRPGPEIMAALEVDCSF